jgi:hypothetical protein
VLFDEVHTRSAVRLAVNHPPAGWNVSEDRPQAVLLLIVDQDEKGAILIIERIGAHDFLSLFGVVADPLSFAFGATSAVMHYCDLPVSARYYLVAVLSSRLSHDPGAVPLELRRGALALSFLSSEV